MFLFIFLIEKIEKKKKKKSMMTIFLQIRFEMNNYLLRGKYVEKKLY